MSSTSDLVFLDRRACFRWTTRKGGGRVRADPATGGASARGAGHRGDRVAAVPSADEAERGAGPGAEPAVVVNVAGGVRRAAAADRGVPRLADGLAVGERPLRRP